MKALVALLLAAFALPAAAQASPWYFGAAAGASRAAHALVRDREATIGNGNEPNLQSDADLRDTAGKLFAGHRFSPLLSVEGHWTDLGRQRLDTSFDVPLGITRRGGVLTNRRIDGYGVDLLVGAEAVAGLRIHGKVGAFRARAKSDTTISGDTAFADGTPGSFRSKSTSETIVKLGLGAEYALTKSVSARLDWERLPGLGTRLVPGATHETGEATQDAWWLAVVLRF